MAHDLRTLPALATLAAALALPACRGTNAADSKPQSAAEAEPVQPDGELPAEGAPKPSDCLFGDTFEDLETSPDFKKHRHADESLVSKLPGADKKTRTYAVTDYRHIKSGQMYTAYTTFRNEDDGGSTSGWIESEASGGLVAEIRDAAFEACKVKSAATTAAAPQVNCLFGADLVELEGSGAFSVTTKSEVAKASRVPGEEGKRRQVHVKALFHTKTNNGYTIYLLHEKDHDSESTGWVEDKGGAVIAQVGEGEIYACTLGANGQKVQVADAGADESYCTFGTVYEDMADSGRFTQGDAEAAKPVAGKTADKQTRPYEKRPFVFEETGQRFTVWATTDNKTGWVEDAAGKVLAEIKESRFTGCKF